MSRRKKPAAKPKYCYLDAKAVGKLPRTAQVIPFSDGRSDLIVDVLTKLNTGISPKSKKLVPGQPDGLVFWSAAMAASYGCVALALVTDVFPNPALVEFLP